MVRKSFLFCLVSFGLAGVTAAQQADSPAGCDQGCYQSCGVEDGCCAGGRRRGRWLGLIPKIDIGLSRCGCELPSYRSVFGGWVGLNDDPGAWPLNFNDGWVIGTARGFYLNDCVRFEIEGAYRNNTADSVNGQVGIDGGLTGRLNHYSSMVNLLRDFGGRGGYKVYGGGGIGVARQDGDFSYAGTNYEIDDWAFAYQAIAGVSAQASQNTDLFVEYRYYGNTQTDLERVGFGPVDTFVYDSNNVVFGVRFAR